MPLTADFYARNEWGDMDGVRRGMGWPKPFGLRGRHPKRLVWNRMPEEAERGLMHWYGKEDNLDAKVRSAVFTVEARDGVLWAWPSAKFLTRSPHRN